MRIFVNLYRRCEFLYLLFFGEAIYTKTVERLMPFLVAPRNKFSDYLQNRVILLFTTECGSHSRESVFLKAIKLCVGFQRIFIIVT